MEYIRVVWLSNQHQKKRIYQKYKFWVAPKLKVVFVGVDTFIQAATIKPLISQIVMFLSRYNVIQLLADELK